MAISKADMRPLSPVWTGPVIGVVALDQIGVDALKRSALPKVNIHKNQLLSGKRNAAHPWKRLPRAGLHPGECVEIVAVVGVAGVIDPLLISGAVEGALPAVEPGPIGAAAYEPVEARLAVVTTNDFAGEIGFKEGWPELRGRGSRCAGQGHLLFRGNNPARMVHAILMPGNKELPEVRLTLAGMTAPASGLKGREE